MLCASAVETQLKRLVTSALERASAFDLIDAAENENLIEPDLARHASDSFRTRNRLPMTTASPECWWRSCKYPDLA
jgi:hypothetical protein